MAAFSLRDVTKKYGDTIGVSDVSLDCESGEILALLGPSGSGKTTTLRVAAGVARPTGGDVDIAGRVVTKVPAWRRNAAFVQESYVLYPHMTVEQNIRFPLKSRFVPVRLDSDEVRRRIRDIA